MGDEYDLKLKEVRKKLDAVDSDILKLLAKRWELVEEVYKIKRADGLPIRQMGRYQSLMNELSKKADKLGVDQAVVHAVWETIHDQSVKTQEKLEKEEREKSG